MKLVKYLANLGYGSRREVESLIAQRRVRHANGAALDARSTPEHADIRVDDRLLDPPPGSVISLHKPAGFVCSSNDVPPLVYDLLPARFRLRSPMMATIGRLDRDSTGLLLLTDDGQMNHRITSPRSHLAKTYEVDLARELRGDEQALFASGTLRLESDPELLAPAVLHVLGATRARITVTEGRYHQVRRMFAAVGNHVQSLARVSIGGLTIGSLPEGEWRLLEPEDLVTLFASPPSTP
ncbi:MAG TPA: pseudouridine synthase [Gemmatimonas sp.]|nr:pseudouridine synthase [Gemmatimonas sp.]